MENFKRRIFIIILNYSRKARSARLRLFRCVAADITQILLLVELIYSQLAHGIEEQAFEKIKLGKFSPREGRIVLLE